MPTLILETFINAPTEVCFDLMRDVRIQRMHQRWPFLNARLRSSASLSAVFCPPRWGMHTWLICRNPFTFLAFFTYFIASLASNKRAPFDLPEAESELVAGFHVEYSGMRFAIFFLAEYANIFVVSSVAVALFWGGWLRPFPNVPWLAPINFVLPFLLAGFVWGKLLIKRRMHAKGVK